MRQNSAKAELWRTAGRALDFPLFYTDNASEAVHLQIILSDSGIYIGVNHTKLRIQQQAVQTKLRYSKILVGLVSVF
jgi:hypothetical protein